MTHAEHKAESKRLATLVTKRRNEMERCHGTLEQKLVLRRRLNAALAQLQEHKLNYFDLVTP